MSDEIEDIIDAQAAEPLIHEQEGVKDQNRSLDELGRAADRKNKNAAAALGILGISTFAINRPGPV